MRKYGRSFLLPGMIKQSRSKVTETAEANEAVKVSNAIYFFLLIKSAELYRPL